MSFRGLRRFASKPAVALSCAGALAALPALAENWTVTPAVGLRETYTTNSNLGPSGQRQDNWVTTATGTVTVNGVGARARVSGTAAVSGVLYATDSQNNYLFPTVNLLGNIEAIEKFFYVDAQVSVTQQFLSPFAPQPADNIGVTENRYTSASYRVSPYIQGVLPGQVTYYVRNDSIWTDPSSTPGNAFTSSYVNRWIARLASPIRTFGWTLEGNTSYTTFTNQQQQSNEIVRGIIHYQPDPQLRLDAIGGYEWNNFIATKSDNIVYGVGAEWRPTERTTLVGDWQERYFGSSYLGALTHRNPFSAFSINASRNSTTQPQQLLALPAGGDVAALLDAAFTTRIPDPAQRAQAVQDFINATGLPPVLQSPLNFYTERVILYDQQSATFTLLGLRNSLAFTVYNRESEAISAAGVPLPPPFGAQTNNTQRGGELAYNHRLTQLTSLTATAARFDTTATAPFTAKSTTDRFLVVVRTRLSPKTDASTGLTYTIFDSNVSNDYTAFTAYVGLNHRF